MHLDVKWLLVLTGVVATVVVGAFVLGQMSVERDAGPATPSAAATSAPSPARAGPAEGRTNTAGATQTAGPLRPGVPMPASHPPMPADVTVAGSADSAGRGGITYNHFRVGNRNVKAILADGDIVWVGTSGGVIRYDTATDDYRLFDVRSGLLSNGVFHLSKLGGQLAVGTYGGGLSLLDARTETWKNLNIQHGLGDGFVYDLLQTSTGDVWVATWSGANRVRGGNLDERESWDLFTVESTAGGLPNDWVYGLAEGPDGAVWLATEGGLARFHEQAWENWRHEDGLGAPYEQVKDHIQFTRDPAKESSHHARQKAEQGLGRVDVAYNPNYIVALLVDETGVVWCGTWGGGLARFDGRSWHNYTAEDGLPGNHVFMLSPGGDDTMWVGTSKGLAKFDGERFVVYTTADGLFADNVFSLATDAQGAMWVGSFGGVSRIRGLGRKQK